VNARNQVDGRRLPGAVVAEKTDDFVSPIWKLRFSQRGQRAETLGDIVQFEKIGGDITQDLAAR
jgi:hypothetical protein